GGAQHSRRADGPALLVGAHRPRALHAAPRPPAPGLRRMRVALVHDYLTQRGGAERVVLSMLRAFPEAPLYTSLYDPSRTFPDYRGADIRPLPLDRIAPLRRWHRLAFPVLAPAFSRLRVPGDVALCSSSGWAHGARAEGRKVVYCHAPARWLYQPDRYLRGRRGAGSAALALLQRRLLEWDRRAAAGAGRHPPNSTQGAGRGRALYRVEAGGVAPPPAADPPRPARGGGGAAPRLLLRVV